MRRSIRSIARAARESEAWPSALLLLAVLVPTVCLLWFMSAAMRNERYAARERLADAYRAQLAASQARIAEHWAEVRRELEEIVKTNSPSAAFACAVRSGLVDSLVVFDAKGQVVYPNSPLPGASQMQPEAAWAEASLLEFSRKDFSGAAKRYRALATQLTNVHLSARALQAAARCLVHAGQTNAAIELVNDVLSRDAYRDALDAQGRLIVANAELMVLEFGDKKTDVFASTARRLEQRLNDYDVTALAAPQRRFLMAQVERLAGPRVHFATLDAERLASDFGGRSLERFVQRSPLPDIWQFALAGGQATAFVKAETLVGRLQRVTLADEIALLPPGTDNAQSFVSVQAGASFPGWKLAVLLADAKPFDAAGQQRTALYLWAGILVVVVMGLLSVLAARSVRRRVALARLKNDLAATVSHELKTPLASMRVLIDTLLDSNRLNEQTTREYLQLIAAENERLSRLIQNFLTFARIEQNRGAFDLSLIPANEIVDAGVNAVRERFNAPGCRFEVQVQPGLPTVLADHDALTTALINLLDNAWKYSGDIKHIVLRAIAQDGCVHFVVQDNGMGIAAGETKRIFESFYQVDRRLSRNGSGCGLGLSIVQSIATAHGGRVSVASEPGRGSTFTIAIPATRRENAVPEEAIA